MVSFSHKIKAAEGLHARPVTYVCKFAMDHAGCVITVSCFGVSASATNMVALLGLNARHDDTLDIQVEGVDEQAVADEFRALLEREL